MSAMEQLSYMFSRLKRGIGAGGESSQPPVKQQMSADISNNTVSASVVEEDGFLVIDGEHESHTGVYASTFESNAIQAQATFCDQVNLFFSHIYFMEHFQVIYVTTTDRSAFPLSYDDAN